MDILFGVVPSDIQPEAGCEDHSPTCSATVRLQLRVHMELKVRMRPTYLAHTGKPKCPSNRLSATSGLWMQYPILYPKVKQFIDPESGHGALSKPIRILAR